jgi:hypothetical protein
MRKKQKLELLWICLCVSARRQVGKDIQDG